MTRWKGRVVSGAGLLTGIAGAIDAQALSAKIADAVRLIAGTNMSLAFALVGSELRYTLNAANPPALQAAVASASAAGSISLNPGFTPLVGFFIQQTNYAFIELMGSFGMFTGTGGTPAGYVVSGGLTNHAALGYCGVNRGAQFWANAFGPTLVQVVRASGSDNFDTGRLIVLGR